MAALGTQVEIALVLWEVFLFFLTTLEPKHERPATQIVQIIVVLHEILAFNCLGCLGGTLGHAEAQMLFVTALFVH